MPTTAALLVLLGCGDRTSSSPEPLRPEPAAPVTTPATTGPPVCQQVEFAETVAVAEASGAVWLASAGRILVVGDSGTRGQYAELDPVSGAVLASGRLPLDDGASDDLEGLAAVGETIYAVTSSGAMRSWRRGDGGYEPLGRAYGIGTLACEDLRATNCGANLEGLCLRPEGAEPGGGCAGFVASKADGHLYCLVWQDQALRATQTRIAITGGERLTGCAYSLDGAELWTGSNFFERNAVRRVGGIASPDRAEVQEVGYLGPGFGEAIAVGPGGALYRFSDTAGSPSAVQKFVCR